MTESFSPYLSFFNSRRGYGKVNKERIPLTDNSIIENVLGDLNIICIEDIVHEIYTVGGNFKQVRDEEERKIKRKKERKKERKLERKKKKRRKSAEVSYISLSPFPLCQTKTTMYYVGEQFSLAFSTFCTKRRLG